MAEVWFDFCDKENEEFEKLVNDMLGECGFEQSMSLPPLLNESQNQLCELQLETVGNDLWLVKQSEPPALVNSTSHMVEDESFSFSVFGKNKEQTEDEELENSRLRKVDQMEKKITNTGGKKDIRKIITAIKKKHSKIFKDVKDVCEYMEHLKELCIDH